MSPKRIKICVEHLVYKINTTAIEGAETYVLCKTSTRFIFVGYLCGGWQDHCIAMHICSKNGHVWAAMKSGT